MTIENKEGNLQHRINELLSGVPQFTGMPGNATWQRETVDVLREAASALSNTRWIPVSAPAEDAIQVSFLKRTVYTFSQTLEGERGQCYELRLPPLPEAPQ